MATKDKALKSAIEALSEGAYGKEREKAIQACKEALAQPAQEPVAWIRDWADGSKDIVPANYESSYPVYTHPAPSCQECENLKHDLEGYMDANKELINREWQGLSDDEIKRNATKLGYLWTENSEISFTMDGFLELFARAIEQALRSKNDY